MHILVINVGSATVKVNVFNNNENLFSQTLTDGFGNEGLLAQIPAILKKNGHVTFDAIGHRIAHGGAAFRDTCLIDDSVIKTIESFVPLAPLHNPFNLAGIKMAQKNWPQTPQYAAFDTAFHHTSPEYASIYAVPKEWRDKGVRRYGFHGTSHKYIMQRTVDELKTAHKKLRVISCHLGNGASVCAIRHGQSIDTSMGMSALGGPVMGTRSGDIDPALYAFLYRTYGLTPEDVEYRLYHDSGLKALAGTNDLRIIETHAANGDKDAQLAIDVFTHHIRHYIGAYAALMNGCDVLAFTGGIGENSALIRKTVCSGFEYMGLSLDDVKNSAVELKDYAAPQIQLEKSQVKIIVTQTREQFMIAQDIERIFTVNKPKESGGPDRNRTGTPVTDSRF